MKKYAIFLLFCWTLIENLRPATAIKCYVCVGCNDPFDASASGILKKTCMGSCMKTKLDNNVARQCSDGKMDSDCKEEEREGHEGALCFCNTDLCNGGDRLSVPMIATGLSVAFAILRNMF